MESRSRSKDRADPVQNTPESAPRHRNVSEAFLNNPIDPRIPPRYLMNYIIDQKRGNSLTRRVELRYEIEHPLPQPKKTKEFKDFIVEYIYSQEYKSHLDIEQRVLLKDYLYTTPMLYRYRRTVWMIASGANMKKYENPGYYTQLAHELKDYPDYFTKQIEVDLLRSFPIEKPKDHDIIIGKMRRILNAYARRNPIVGYCQGMSFLALKIVQTLKDEEDSFWLLVVLLEDILPIDYFNMVGVIIDEKIFNELICLKYKKVWEKFAELEFNLSTLCLEWFLCCFTSCFPDNLTDIVWDLMFTEGSIVFFKVALVVIEEMSPRILKANDIGDIFEITKSGKLNMKPEDFLAKLDNIYVNSKLIKVLRKQYNWIVREELRTLDLKKVILPGYLKNPNHETTCNSEWPICYFNLERYTIKRRDVSVLTMRVENIEEHIKTNYFSSNFKDYPHYISFYDVLRSRRGSPMKLEKKDPDLMLGYLKHICHTKRKSVASHHKRTLTPNKKEAIVYEPELDFDRAELERIGLNKGYIHSSEKLHFGNFGKKISENTHSDGERKDSSSDSELEEDVDDYHLMMAEAKKKKFSVELKANLEKIGT